MRATFLVPLLVLLQPWVAETGFMALTQTPLALLMSAALYLSVTQRWHWLGLVLGLLPLVRHEALALTGLGLLYLGWQRQWRAAALGLLPMVLYNAAHMAVSGYPASANLLAWQPTTEYGAGGWLHFATPLRWGVGVPVLLLSGLGLVSLRRPWQRWVFVPWYLAYIGLHTVIYRFGLFASGGYGVFLEPTAPLFAILALRGTEVLQGWLGERARQRQARRWWPAATWAVIVSSVIANGLFAKPTPLGALDAAVVEASQWVARRHSRATPVLATHVWFHHVTGVPMPQATDEPRPVLAKLPAGTLAVWDAKYSDKLGLPLSVLQAPEGRWRDLLNVWDQVRVFELRDSPRHR